MYATVLGVGVGAWALYSFAVSPYLEMRNDLVEQINNKSNEEAKNDRLLRDARNLKADWDKLDVRVTPADADSRLAHYLREWAQEARLALSSSRPERGKAEKGFLQVVSHGQAEGTQESLVKLLWAMERSNIPVRVDELSITAKKEGENRLSVNLNVSTLCVDPDAGKPNKGTRTASAGGSAVAVRD